MSDFVGEATPARQPSHRPLSPSEGIAAQRLYRRENAFLDALPRSVPSALAAFGLEFGLVLDGVKARRYVARAPRKRSSEAEPGP